MDHQEVLTSEPDRSESHLPEPIGPVEQTSNRLTGPTLTGFPSNSTRTGQLRRFPLMKHLLETPCKLIISLNGHLPRMKTSVCLTSAPPANHEWSRSTATFHPISPTAAEDLLHEFKDIFVWSYQDLRGVPAEVCQHCIELKLDATPSASTPLPHEPQLR